MIPLSPERTLYLKPAGRQDGPIAVSNPVRK